MTVLDTQMVEMEEVQKPQQPTQPAQGGWYVPSVYMGAPANYLVQYLPPTPPQQPKRSAWFHVLTAPLQPRTFGLYAYYMILVPMFMILSLCTIAPFFWTGIATSIFGVGILLLLIGLWLARMYSVAHVRFMKVFVNFTNIDDMITERVCIGARQTLKAKSSWGTAFMYQLFWPVYWMFAMFIIKGFFCLTMFCMTMMLVKAGAPSVDPFDSSVQCGWLCTRRALLLWAPCFVMSLYCTTWSAIVFAHLERVIVFKAFTRKQDAYSYQMFHNHMNPAQPIIVPVVNRRTVNRTCARVCWRGLSTCFWFLSILITCLVCLHISLILRCKFTEHADFVKQNFSVLRSSKIAELKSVSVQVNLPAGCYWAMQNTYNRPTVTVIPTDTDVVTFNSTYKYLGARSNFLFASNEYDGRVHYEVKWGDSDAYFANIHGCPHHNVTVYMPQSISLNVSIAGQFATAKIDAAKNIKHLSLSVYRATIDNFVGSLSVYKHMSHHKLAGLTGYARFDIKNSVIDRLYMKSRAIVDINDSEILNYMYMKTPHVYIYSTTIAASEITIKKAQMATFWNVNFAKDTVRSVNVTGRYITMHSNFQGLVVMNPRGTVYYTGRTMHEYCANREVTAAHCIYNAVMTLTTTGHFRRHRGHTYGEFIEFYDWQNVVLSRPAIGRAAEAGQAMPADLKKEVEKRRFSWFG